MREQVHPSVQAARNYDRLLRYRCLDALGLRFVDAESDRVWALAGPDCEEAVLARFDQLVASQDLQEGPTGRHRVPAGVLATCGATHSKAIRSYRGRIHGSLAGDQWVVHRLFADGVIKELVIEQDVDPDSPVDVAGFLPHVVTVFNNWRLKRQTDARKVAELLDRAGIA